MLRYNSDKPLVFIHIHKTGGTSMLQVFVRNCENKERLVWHYPVYENNLDPLNSIFIGKEPINICTSENIQRLKERGIQNPIFYGHFYPYYLDNFPPECEQFMSVLRDPFDLQVSCLHWTKNKYNIQFSEDLNIIVEKYINSSPFLYRFSNVFNKEILTLDNYKEVLHKYFIHIGTLDRIKDTECFVEKNIGLRDSNTLPINQYPLLKKRDQSKPFYSPDHLRQMHREKWPLDYAIYDYVSGTPGRT